MLLDELKKANVEAMKSKDVIARKALSAVISKCMLIIVEKRATSVELADSDVIAALMKTIKEIEEEAEAFKNAGRHEHDEEYTHQVEVLTNFLPKMLSEEEIRLEIEKLPQKNIPTIMKHFKENFTGKCDMKLVNTIAKDYK